MTQPLPFVLEDGVEKPIPPPPLVVLVLAQLAFERHAQPLKHPGRAPIGGDSP